MKTIISILFALFVATNAFAADQQKPDNATEATEEVKEEAKTEEVKK